MQKPTDVQQTRPRRGFFLARLWGLPIPFFIALSLLVTPLAATQEQNPYRTSLPALSDLYNAYIASQSALAQTDTDGDGVNDDVDVDDDNDGILDTVECSVSPPILNALGTGNGEYHEDGMELQVVAQSDGSVTDLHSSGNTDDILPGVVAEQMWSLETVTFIKETDGTVHQYGRNGTTSVVNLGGETLVDVTGDHTTSLLVLSDGTLRYGTDGGSFDSYTFGIPTPAGDNNNFVAAYGSGLSGSMYAQKSDGTMWGVNSSQQIFPLSGLDNTIDLTDHYYLDNPYVYAVLADGTYKYFDGSTSNSSATINNGGTVSGESFVSVASGSTQVFLLSDAGNVYQVSQNTLTQLNQYSGIDQMYVSGFDNFGADGNGIALFIDTDTNTVYYSSRDLQTFDTNNVISLPAGYTVEGGMALAGSAYLSLTSPGGDPEIWGGSILSPSSFWYPAFNYVTTALPALELITDTPLLSGAASGGGAGSGGGSSANCDADNDGIDNQLDLDSDNDGIPDNVEAQTTQGYIAPANDTLATYTTNNGLNSAYLTASSSGGLGLTPVDTDNLGDNPDYLDLDSDEDGDFDIVESGQGLTQGTTPGRVDSATVGTNGLSNDAAAESADNYTDPNGEAHNGTNFNLQDSDGDTNADGSNADPANNIDFSWRDASEPPTVTLSSNSPVNEGVSATITALIPFTSSQPITVTLVFTDGSATGGGTDYDPSGITEIVIPAGQTSAAVNVPTNGTDGLVEGTEDFQVDATNVEGAIDGTAPQTVQILDIDAPTDTDGDSIPDNVDIDDDNDGILDTVEGAPGGLPAVDTDGDGVPDSLDLDTDNDGIPDTLESVPQGSTPLDADADGVIDTTEAGGFGANGLADNVETTPESSDPDYDGDNSGPDSPADTDGDGVGDWRDLDSDNDGINDVDESGNGPGDTAPGGLPDGMIDDPDGADGDGLVGAADGDDATDGGAATATTPVDDTDSDTVPDYRDLDSDNDGINDVDEGGNGPHDTNDDGMVDGNDTDGDGILPNVDGNEGTYGDANDPVHQDTDSDTVPDYRDLDSDNDGINDVDEGGNGPHDTNDDGMVDGNDTDGDGILPNVDGNEGTYGDANDPVHQDTDSDGVPDSQDLDADNDGINDVDEDAPSGLPGPLDTNDDGVIDGTDTDNDGILPAVDGNEGTYGDANDPVHQDTDSDGVPDSQDLDTDNDGINDVDEGGNGPSDGNDDGMVDGPDNDNDGIQDPVDGDDNTFGDANDPVHQDTDGDTVPDSQDLDSDNDGINDVIEGGNGPDDGNNDGMVDGTDTDGDGILPNVDGNEGTYGDANDPVHLDTDNDNVPDSQDLDSDNDTINDVAEGPHPGEDPDGNGIIDPAPGSDPDMDGIQGGADGAPNTPGDASDPGAPDTNNGTPEPDFQDPSNGSTPNGTADPDSDGIIGDADGDPNNRGDAASAPDTDGDGVPDHVDIDDDNDGILDTVEGGGAVDTDSDGVPDSLDLDTDNDGIPDTLESVPQGSPPLDANADGVIDNTEAGGFGANGLADNVETTPESGDPDYDGDNAGPDSPADTDGDGVGDWRDLDADNDGINDVDEGGNGPGDTAPGGLPDGMIDDPDGADGDGLVGPADADDNTRGEAETENDPVGDTDSDTVPDYRDLDSDNDGINDVIEGGNSPHDINDDGMVDGTDTNGDGILPNVDGNEGAYGDANDPPHQDTDGDGVPDSQDLDSDNDALNDVEEGPHPGEDPDGNGIIDPAAGSDPDMDGIQGGADGGPNTPGDLNDPGAPDTNGGTPAPDFQDPANGTTPTGTDDPDMDGIIGDADGDANTRGDLGAQDDDGDTVPNTVEDGAPNNGDGNGDGTPDKLQGDVASLPNASNLAYVTAEVTGNCNDIDGIYHTTEAALAAPDTEYDYPLGLMGITLTCLTNGESATVKYYWHAASDLTGLAYRKYGPQTPGGSPDLYYDFAHTYGQATIDGNPVATSEIVLTDGVMGDDTVTDGTIVDPSGPANTLQKSTLGDWVWYDVDGDGIKDLGETGINGVLINLYRDGADGSTPNGIMQATELILDHHHRQ